jgi:hypothetical protein
LDLRPPALAGVCETRATATPIQRAGSEREAAGSVGMMMCEVSVHRFIWSRCGGALQWRCRPLSAAVCRGAVGCWPCSPTHCDAPSDDGALGTWPGNSQRMAPSCALECRHECSAISGCSAIGSTRHTTTATGAAATVASASSLLRAHVDQRCDVTACAHTHAQNSTHSSPGNTGHSDGRGTNRAVHSTAS